MFLILRGSQELRAHHRRRRQRDHHRNGDRDRQRHGELAEQPPDDSAHQQNRNEYRDQRHADRQHRETDLPGPDQRRLERGFAFLQVTRDVLDHDDRVVDDEACGDRERHQREIVEAVAEQIHRAKSAHEGDRHDDARDECRSRASEENEDDEDDERDRDRERQLDVLYGRADGPGRVDNDVQFHRRRNRGLHLRQDRADPVDGLDDVRARLPEDDQDDRRLAVGESHRVDVFDGIGHLRDVTQAQRGAVCVVDEERPVFRSLQKLVRRRERV